MKALLGLLAAGLALFAFTKNSHASEAEPGERRKVTGKSGRVWFTETAGSDDAGVVINVFASKSSNDLVLSYKQMANGTRRIGFQAPTTLATDAIRDFIGETVGTVIGGLTQRTGKSGQKWFTMSQSVTDDPGFGSQISVFADAAGTALVLDFRVPTGGVGKPKIIFQAPSTLTPIAISDFIGG